MKTLALTLLAAIAAVFFLPVDLDVQASIVAALGFLAIVSRDYAGEERSLSIRADLVPFPAHSQETAIGEAA